MSVHRPSTLEELQAIVAAARQVRAVGSRHSFNDIADAEEQVALTALPADVVVDRDAATVSFGAGLTYGELAGALEREGVALHNLASLPHISVAGAVATATHGSGDANGNLATAVAALELVTSSGELVTAARGDPDFDGMVVGLGALGVVTRLTLDVEPAYEVRQRVFEELAWDALFEHFDAITGSGYSVSVLSYLGETVDQVWVRSRVTDAPEVVRDDLFGARPATVDRHPILGLDPVNCTPQLGRPGAMVGPPAVLPHGLHPERRRGAAERVPGGARARRGRDRGGARPGRPHPPGPPRLRDPHGRRRPAVDEPAVRARQRRHPLHLGARARGRARVLAELEPALEPFEPRPHWGKLFLHAPRYERLPDFARLAETLDPRGAFRNAWLEARVLGQR